MKRGVSKFIFTAIMILTLLSCTKETIDPYGGSGQESLIRIGMRGALFDSNPDDKIANFRIIAIDRTMNIVRNNLYYSSDTLESTLSLSLYTGTYDFVFIANEPSGTVHDALNAVTTRAGLANIQFPASQFNSNDDIPMLLVVDNVKVLADDQGVSINGGAVQSPWTIRMERMGVRFDITLKSLKDLSSIFMGIEISNMPDAVPLTGVFSGSHSTGRTYSYSDSQYFRDTTIAGYAWAVKVQRVIMPSNVFSPPGDPDSAVKLTVLLDGVDVNPSTLVGFDILNDNFTLPPNSLFLINSSIKFPTELSISATVTPWETVTWSSSMGD